MDQKQFLENLSSHLKNTIARAIAFAASTEASAVAPSHLLLALAEEKGAVGADILNKIQFDTTAATALVIAKTKKRELNTEAAVTPGALLPHLNSAAKQVLEKAMFIAYEQSHTYVGTEHLLFGLIHSSDATLQTVIQETHVNTEGVEEQLHTIFHGTARFTDIEEVSDLMGHAQHIMETDQSAEQPETRLETPKKEKTKTPKKHLSATEIFTVNLTSPEILSSIDPVIGRDREIERTIHILARRNKNNPILVGEPGVGKTAIVEGLAKKIAAGDVPDVLKRKKILSLDLTLLIAGTIYRGEFEARLKQIIDEVSHDQNAILFIDEIHNIIGAGSNQGTMDAANILKPALARGELRCIGATTIDEYTKHIMTDPALERRLQSVTVAEPSLEETVGILKGIKKYYEAFHKTIITDDAIDAAVHLSAKYVHDQFLPDKAIDLIDEAGAALRSRKKFTPEETTLHELEDKINEAEEKKERAIYAEAFDEAMKYKKDIERLEKELTKAEQKFSKTKKLSPKSRVTRTDIAATLGRKLNIDERLLLENEWEQLVSLPERLKTHIVGQDQAIDDVIRALEQAQLGLGRARKTFASLLFAGPSGVGKTGMAKALAKELYHDEKALIRFDMSEFTESHSVSKILGSPAGYIGHQERNRFTDSIRKRPYSVILFDEFDKAHPDVRRLLLQILDEGELTDSHGKKIPFQHAVVILTTNIGAELFKTSGIGFGSGSKKTTNDMIHEKLKEELGASLLGRIARICLFSPLEQAHLEEIVTRNIVSMSDALLQKERFTIAPDAHAITSLATEHYHPDLGARQLGHAVDQTVHNLITDILHGARRKKTYRLTKTEGAYKLV